MNSNTVFFLLFKNIVLEVEGFSTVKIPHLQSFQSLIRSGNEFFFFLLTQRDA